MKYENWNKIDLFIGSEEDPLKKYDYFFKKIDFSKCNYSFIIPEPLSDLFSSFYSKILKDSFIIFPKDFEQAKELLNDYENEEGYKENWIIIAPCMELKKNIKLFHENIDIICFIGYCPIFNHWDDDLYFHLFSKFYGIVDSYSELIEKLFQLSNIFYLRKKQNYFINNKNADIIELKYDTKFLIDIQDEKAKECVISEKLDHLFDFKMNNDQYYFTLIKTYSFLSKCLKEKNYILIDNTIGRKLENMMLLIEDLHYEKGVIGAVFLKDLHLLYFYFHNYPYLYGLVTDEEINQIFSKFQPKMEKKDLDKIVLVSYNAIFQITTLFAMNIDMGISLFEDKQRLKNFQLSLIEFNLYTEYIIQKFDIEKFGKYYQIKNFYRDIDFCLCKCIYSIINFCPNFPLKKDIFHYMSRDNQFTDYINYGLHLQKDNMTPETEDEKIFNQAIKYNDTIVIGDKYFVDIIKKMKLPCKNLYYINEKEILKFFKNPKKIDNKYKICKYLIIMNEKNAIDYLETLKYICNEYVLKIIIIIYSQNKNIKIDKKILQKPLIPIILAYSEQDILNYYNDHFFRLKEKNIKYFDRNVFLDEVYGTNFKYYKLPKLTETKFIKEEDNGWDMKKDINTNVFDLIKVEKVLGAVRSDIFVRNMYKVYKENNCLNLYFKYYGNYFGADHIVEETATILTNSKMFLYAYTLEENNGKSFYSLMNNDFRSGNAEKICRYLPEIKIIYDLIKGNYLKSYEGDVYRATYFKKELIDKIKSGEKMFNASLWSSSKKLSVAKKFLFKYKKNILLHTKVIKGNNVDIHLERLSQYPSEEEILFLPFCCFEIKSFKKVKENNLEYYELELIFCEEENKRNKIENVKTHEFII